MTWVLQYKRLISSQKFEGGPEKKWVDVTSETTFPSAWEANDAKEKMLRDQKLMGIVKDINVQSVTEINPKPQGTDREFHESRPDVVGN